MSSRSFRFTLRQRSLQLLAVPNPAGLRGTPRSSLRRNRRANSITDCAARSPAACRGTSGFPSENASSTSRADEPPDPPLQWGRSLRAMRRHCTRRVARSFCIRGSAGVRWPAPPLTDRRRAARMSIAPLDFTSRPVQAGNDSMQGLGPIPLLACAIAAGFVVAMSGQLNCRQARSTRGSPSPAIALKSHRRDGSRSAWRMHFSVSLRRAHLERPKRAAREAIGRPGSSAGAERAQDRRTRASIAVSAPLRASASPCVSSCCFSNSSTSVPVDSVPSTTTRSRTVVPQAPRGMEHPELSLLAHWSARRASNGSWSHSSGAARHAFMS